MPKLYFLKLAIATFVKRVRLSNILSNNFYGRLRKKDSIKKELPEVNILDSGVFTSLEYCLEGLEIQLPLDS